MTFTFDTDFETGQVVPETLGSLVLAGGHRIRIAFLPDGVHLFVPESARKAIHFYPDPPVLNITGLGEIASQEANPGEE